MKTKLLLLAATLLAANVSFAQIEELSSTSRAEPQKARFADRLKKSDCPIDLGETMYNLVGMHLYQASKIPMVAIIADNNNVRISLIESGENYEVVDILSIKEGRGLCMNWQRAKFVSETIQYSVNGKNFKRKTAIEDLESFLPQYKLKDSKGNTVYINAKFVGPFVSNINIADVSAFICVEAYNKLKSTFEGKQMAVDYINYDKTSFVNGKYFTMNDVNPNQLYQIQKIAVLEGKLAAAIQQPDGKIENYTIENLGKASMNVLHKKDSLVYLHVETDGGSRRLGSGEGHILFAKSDLDSIVLKWEQEGILQEREKLEKDEKRKQDLIAKYGQKYAQDIIKGTPSVGMNREMCLEACGQPNRGISKSTTKDGEKEEWTYAFYSNSLGYIYVVEVIFIDGKISSVEEVEGSIKY